MIDLESLKRAAEGAQKVSAIEGDWTSYWRKTDGEADCGVVASKREGQAYSVCRAPRYMEKEDWKRIGAHIVAANPSTILKLIARLEASERDGARYRWLRDETRWTRGEFAVCQIAYDGFHTVLKSPSEIDCRIDAAIDAQIAARKE